MKTDDPQIIQKHQKNLDYQAKALMANERSIFRPGEKRATNELLSKNSFGINSINNSQEKSSRKQRLSMVGKNGEIDLQEEDSKDLSASSPLHKFSENNSPANRKQNNGLHLKFANSNSFDDSPAPGNNDSL